MKLRHSLAAALIAATASTATAGIGDAASPQKIEQHRDFPRPMPQGLVQQVSGNWESVKEWFRMKLGVATPMPRELQ